MGQGPPIAGSYADAPIKECPHCISLFINKDWKDTKELDTKCHDCDNPIDNWICVKCL